MFLSLDTVRYAKPLRPSFFGVPATETRPMRFRATWVVRGTGGEMYKSKVCSSEAEAVRLARAWLARMQRNVPNFEATYGHPQTRYVDTTEQPERFGYSHPVKSFYPEPQ